MAITLFEHTYQHIRKNHTDGTHRLRSPRDTLDAYLPLCSAFGITRLANVTGLDYIGIPVYQCVRPNSRTLAVSQGKGLTLEAAKASALMESIETWHSEWPAAPTRFESLHHLSRRATVIDVARLPRESRRQVTPELVLPWIEGYDIARGERVWIPHEFVSLNRVYPPGYFPLFQNTSNGLASGNHALEAVLHGLSEVIERDALTLWECRSGPIGTSSLVDLSTIDDPACRYVLDKFRDAGAVIGVHDVTSDVGVPCFSCVVLDHTNPIRPLGICAGTGCHPAREIALLRALTEAAQDRLTAIAGARDDQLYADYAARRNADDSAALIAMLQGHDRGLDFRSRPSVATDTFDGDLELLLAALRRVGCDSVVVVDLSQPDYGVAVTKVIVPGLEGGLGNKPLILGERGKRAVRPRGRR
jgi:YcaO-like protein with predicted kinase domain